VTHIQLAQTLIVRDDRVLLVASSYPNRAEPLWNLPGGRQRFGELLSETAERELFEETGLHGVAGELAYINESYDGERHFIAAVFHTSVRDGTPVAAQNDHVEAVEWVPLDAIAERIVADVVRAPLLAYLGGDLRRRYAGRLVAGISVEWPDEA
jgi:ADP-ribose pyrophosphatase YjhB (NUDIX family)